MSQSQTLSPLSTPDIWHRGMPLPPECNFAYYPAADREKKRKDLARRIYRQDAHGAYIQVAVFDAESDAQLVVEEHNRMIESRQMIRDLSDRVDSLSEKWGDPEA